MTCTPKVVLSTLLPGLLAIAVFWFVLRSRAGEHERLRAERPRPQNPAPPPRAVEAPPVAVAVVESAATSPPAPQTRVAPAPPPAPVAPAIPDGSVPFLRRPEREEIPALQAKAQDLSADPEERVAALARLRIAKPDGRSPEVVRSMIDLLRTSPDAALRADICRQLNRVVSEDLKHQLLVTGRTDADARAR